MKKRNKIFKTKVFLAFLLVLLLNTVFNRPVFAGPQEYHRCRPSVDCIIGEYVFDNSGAPITSSICTIDIRNPSGTLIIDDAAMTPNSDGWHYYTVNIASPEGFYRALMTCNNSGDIGYLDKSFYLGTTFENVNTSVWSYTSDLGTILATNLGKAIWEYSTRTLTSFGTLIADIWSYTTRTLTESAITAADVWNYATRTLTGATLNSGQLATKTIVDEATASAVLSIKTTNNYDLSDIIGYVDTLETSIGTSSDTSSSNTVFGKIKAVQDTVDQLTTIDTNIDTLISKWGSYSASDIYGKVKNLSSDISAINTVSNVSSILSLAQTNETNVKEVKNKVLAMKAIIDVNRTLLEKVSNQPVIKTWLEEGSIIFKTLITNPSGITSQTVPLKYYLPRELRKEDIIKMDEELKVDYDTSQEAYFVSAEFELGPKETKVVSVEVKDIWKISDNEVESLRKQAEELLNPLKSTSYYAQGALVKSDVDVSLDKILRIQKEATTPQGRIRAYREAKAEMQIVEGKLEIMKTLVVSAGSMGTIFGFIGGVQTLGVWGLIIVLIAGFVFLALYIRILSLQQHNYLRKGHSISNQSIDFWAPVRPYLNKKTIKIAVIVFLAAGLAMFIINFLTTRNNLPARVIQTKEKVTETPMPTSTSQPEKSDKEKEEIQVREEKQVLGTASINSKVKVVVPEDDAVNIRKEPSLNSEVIGKFWISREVTKISEKDDWVKIKVNLEKDGIKYSEGWVNRKFIEE